MKASIQFMTSMDFSKNNYSTSQDGVATQIRRGRQMEDMSTSSIDSVLQRVHVHESSFTSG